MDIIKNWGRVVDLAKTATVIFQGADYGAFMDLAVENLCRSLEIPYVTASTYSQAFQV